MQLAQERGGVVAGLDDVGELEEGGRDEGAEMVVQGAAEPGVLDQEGDDLFRGPDDVGG